MFCLDPFLSSSTILLSEYYLFAKNLANKLYLFAKLVDRLAFRSISFLIW